MGGSVIVYKRQNILIAESAEAARRNAKVFPDVRPFEFDAVVPGFLVRWSLSSVAFLGAPPRFLCAPLRSKAVNGENLVLPPIQFPEDPMLLCGAEFSPKR